MQPERLARADVLLASVLTVLALVEVAAIDQRAQGFVLALLMSAPLAWRCVAPLPVALVVAGAAEQVIDRDPDAAREALGTIRATGKAALVDLRHMLGVLRSDGAAPAGEPQPGLDALAGRVRAAGLPVKVEVEGERQPVGPGVELAAYRVIQESLTNALKHARGSHATSACATRRRCSSCIRT